MVFFDMFLFAFLASGVRFTSHANGLLFWIENRLSLESSTM